MSAERGREAGRLTLGTVDSTNAEGFRRAGDHALPLWILAGAQEAGRGRRARAWASPPGNFHATLVDRPPGTPADFALRSFAAALALREALAGLTGTPEALALKWPNDLLLDGGKVSGILLEATGGVLCIGIGVNLIAAPPPEAVEPGAVTPVSVLGVTGQRIAPGQLLDALAPAMARWEAVLRRHGFAPLRAAWLAHAARLGQTIRARTQRDAFEGRFETIDADGSLVLATAAGRVSIPAADVFF